MFSVKESVPRQSSANVFIYNCIWAERLSENSRKGRNFLAISFGLHVNVVLIFVGKLGLLCKSSVKFGKCRSIQVTETFCLQQSFITKSFNKLTKGIHLKLHMKQQLTINSETSK